MKKNDYVLYSIQNKFVHKHEWFFTFFTILTDSFTTNNYLTLENKKWLVKVGSNLEVLEDTDGKNQPLLDITAKIKVAKGFLPNIKSDIETTVGRLILNYLALAHNFGDKIDYINEEFDPGTVEKKIAAKLTEKVVTIQEYLNYVDTVYYLCGLGRIFNISATPKSIVPPPNINKIKKDLKEEFNKKYGPDWVKDRDLMVEFQARLKEVDKDWLKDDPSNGKLLGSKIKDNARVKMFLTVGPEVGFDKKSGKATMIENSLQESMPESKEQLAAMFNGSRSGSFDRGHETQKGGAVAKDILRASSSIHILKTDCGTRLGKEVFVTEENYKSLVGRYYITESGVKKIEDPSKLILRTIKLRSPMYCNAKGSDFCAICAGEFLGASESGVSAALLEISKTLITSALKSMHNSMLKTMDVNFQDMIK